MPPTTDPSSGPYGAYDPTVISQHSGTNYPAYPPFTSDPNYPSYPTPSMPGGPAYLPPYQPGGPGFNTPTPQPKRNNGRTILISVIALLVVIGGVLSLVLYNNHQTSINNANGTATAVVSTAQAYSQATAHTQATATYVKSHYPFSSNLVLNDTLNDNSNVAKYGWDTGAHCAFTNNTYQVTEDKSGYFAYCTATRPSFTNFTYEVQMSIQEGGNNADGGIVFRANMDSSLFYVLYLGTDGYYELDIQTNSNATNTRTLKSGTIAGFAAGFTQVHTIGVVANGSQISLYIDHNQVTQVDDTTFSSGQIGVISAYGSSKTVVVYNNAKVWQL